MRSSGPYNRDTKTCSSFFPRSHSRLGKTEAHSKEPRGHFSQPELNEPTWEKLVVTRGRSCASRSGSHECMHFGLGKAETEKMP